ncbi:MAG: helix-turn-helix transcriptional regulator [Lachnospiraceae bacterium]|nr:helix-turn-helix transcriptional regulator [Lachnospiraceae bacterium]
MSEAEINKIIANNINKLLNMRNKTQVELADYMNVSQATVSNWCKGLKTPRMDKIDKICVFFNCKRSDLMEEKDETTESYYLNDDAKEIAQFLYDNPEYKVLFDTTRKVKKEDIDFVKQMIDRVRGDGDDTNC